MKILIVDDTPSNIRILNEVLLGEYDLYFATSGSDGIAIARRELPDLILLDVMMPGMSGYEVCSTLKADPVTRPIPVVFVTAMSEVEDETKGFEMGAIDYITKPISPPIVKARVKTHLELKRHRDSLVRLNAELGDKNRELERERALAHKVLESILQQELLLPGLRTAVFFRPSRQIGGDFFDAWLLNGQTHFLIGDISGHSISAALMMAVCKGMFHSLGHALRDPLEIVPAANRMLHQMLSDSQMFLTLVYAVLDMKSGVVRLVSAGHNPVYLLDGSAATAIESTGPALGWDLEDSWQAVEHRLPPEAMLFLYTDGLVEARDAQGGEFGTLLPEQLLGQRSPRELTAAVVAELERFHPGDLEDDVTILAVSRDGDEG